MRKRSVAAVAYARNAEGTLPASSARAATRMRRPCIMFAVAFAPHSAKHDCARPTGCCSRAEQATKYASSASKLSSALDRPMSTEYSCSMNLRWFPPWGHRMMRAPLSTATPGDGLSRSTGRATRAKESVVVHSSSERVGSPPGMVMVMVSGCGRGRQHRE